MNVGDLNKVWEIKALKKPGAEEATKFLEKIAKQVQPIMRKYKWRVKILSEFCPKNPSLMGLNVGSGVHVKLRLRRPNRDWDFFPYDQVLDTMLHELCHNVHGPHNANFYKLWDELRKECEELMIKGISGTGMGFDLRGRRLNGFSHQPPLSSLRQTALEAAEKRARLGALLPTGPKRVGGDSAIMVALSPVQAAAMAAERRLLDEIWCGSQSCENPEEEESNSDISQGLSHEGKSAGSLITRGSDAQDLNAVSRRRNHELNSNGHLTSYLSNSGSGFVDLTVDASTSDNDAKSKKRSWESDMGVSVSESSLNQNATDNADESNMWECGTCTFLNTPLAPVCNVCSAIRPKDVPTKHKLWSCKFCTLENSVKLDKCLACEQWRYSRGPPVSTRPPNLGT